MPLWLIPQFHVFFEVSPKCLRVLWYCFGVLLLYPLEEHVVDCGSSMEGLKNTAVISLDLFDLTKGKQYIFARLLKLKSSLAVSAN